jgi:hypothetical protein
LAPIPGLGARRKQGRLPMQAYPSPSVPATPTDSLVRANPSARRGGHLGPLAHPDVAIADVRSESIQIVKALARAPLRSGGLRLIGQARAVGTSAPSAPRQRLPIPPPVSRSSSFSWAEMRHVYGPSGSRLRRHGVAANGQALSRRSRWARTHPRGARAGQLHLALTYAVVPDPGQVQRLNAGSLG